MAKKDSKSKENVTISNAEIVEATAKKTGQSPEQVGTIVNAYGGVMIDKVSAVLTEYAEKEKDVAVVAVTPVGAIEVSVDMKEGEAEIACHPRVELGQHIIKITKKPKDQAGAKKVA